MTKRDRETSNNTSTSFMDQLFKSTDSISQIFQTKEPVVLKSNDHIFKSNNSSFLSGLFKSGDSLFKSSTEKLMNVFNSRDWKQDYEANHVDVPVQNVFHSTQSTSLGPSDDNNNWNSLFLSQLPPPSKPNKMEPPAPRPFKKPKVVSSGGGSTIDNKSSLPAVAKQQPKGIEPNDEDVLLGRGGRTNNHPGNKKYLEAKERIQPRYLEADKNDKTTISQELVDEVHAWGGRFLKLQDEKWVEIDEKTARKKASQTLREINTPEMRAAKRAKYNYKK